MAQMHDEAYHAGMQGSTLPLRTAAIMNWTGAALSVALVVGVSLWSYRLMVRDVSGVPVIQALEGPMRVSPDDPGGRRTAHQGLAVNVVAAQGHAAPASDAVVLAPPPVELAPEDRMAVRLGDPSDPQTALLAAVRAAPETPAAMPETATEVAPESASESAPDSATESAAEAPDRVAGIGPTRSPVPPRRPGGLRARPAVATPGEGVVTNAAFSGGTDPTAEAVLQDLATRIATPSVTEIDSASLAPGTRLVQFGAYDDEPTARARWDALQERFPAQLEGRGRIIEEAAAGGSTFYRLRAHGFSDEPEARRFCAVFQHERVDCVPVLVR